MDNDYINHLKELSNLEEGVWDTIKSKLSKIKDIGRRFSNQPLDNEIKFVNNELLKFIAKGKHLLNDFIDQISKYSNVLKQEDLELVNNLKNLKTESDKINVSPIETQQSWSIISAIASKTPSYIIKAYENELGKLFENFLEVSNNNNINPLFILSTYKDSSPFIEYSNFLNQLNSIINLETKKKDSKSSELKGHLKGLSYNPQNPIFNKLPETNEEKNEWHVQYLLILHSIVKLLEAFTSQTWIKKAQGYIRRDALKASVAIGATKTIANSNIDTNVNWFLKYDHGKNIYRILYLEERKKTDSGHIEKNQYYELFLEFVITDLINDNMQLKKDFDIFELIADTNPHLKKIIDYGLRNFPSWSEYKKHSDFLAKALYEFIIGLVPSPERLSAASKRAEKTLDITTTDDNELVQNIDPSEIKITDDKKIIYNGTKTINLSKGRVLTPGKTYTRGQKIPTIIANTIKDNKTLSDRFKFIFQKSL
jgi:hypothetical protein